MRAAASAPLAVAFAIVALAAPVPKVKDRRPDAERFVGRWETVVAEENGKARAKPAWTFDDKLELQVLYPDDGNRFTTWKVKIDPEKSPKQIDIEGFKGIYEFDGGDIKVAFSSGDRPTSFDPKPGVDYRLLRRAADK